jgi:hypothetical protein
MNGLNGTNMIEVTKKTCRNHVAVRVEVDGKNMGWLQMEKDNLTYYRQTLHGAEVKDLGGMVFIRYSKSTL